MEAQTTPVGADYGEIEKGLAYIYSGDWDAGGDDGTGTPGR